MKKEEYVKIGDYTIVKSEDGVSLLHKDGRTWSDTVRAMHHLIKEVDKHDNS